LIIHKSYRPFYSHHSNSILILNMIKIKSKSREFRECEAVARYAVSRRSANKENRVLRTAEHRNNSHDYLPHSHHFQGINFKAR